MTVMESKKLWENIKILHEEVKIIYGERKNATKGLGRKDKVERKNIEKPFNKRIRALYVAIDFLLSKFFKIDSVIRKNKEPCPWCNAEYTILDDDFGQPLHPHFIRFCFFCGREFEKK
jgi:hypothetical protein